MTSLLFDLEKKIKLQRGAHSYFEGNWKVRSIIIKTILIILPAFLTFVSFSDFDFLKTFVPSITEEKIRLTIGITSFILFITGVISEIFKISIMHESHRDSIEEYSELLREIKEFGDQVTNEQIANFNQRYIAISRNAAPMSTKEFIKGEKYHLKVSATRKARKENPFGMPWEIRKRAIEISQENSDRP